jgi:hypothetical protein
MKMYEGVMYRFAFSWLWWHYLEVSGELHTPAALLYSPAKRPWHPLNTRQVGPQSRSGRYGGVKILDHTGTSASTPRSFSPSQPIFYNCLKIKREYEIFWTKRQHDFINLLRLISTWISPLFIPGFPPSLRSLASAACSVGSLWMIR